LHNSGAFLRHLKLHFQYRTFTHRISGKSVIMAILITSSDPIRPVLLELFVRFVGHLGSGMASSII